MTFPITPNPAVHHLPEKIIEQNRALSSQALTTFGQQLIQGVMNALVSLIFGGSTTSLGAPPPGSTSQSAPATLQSWLQGLSGQATASAMNQGMLTGKVQGTTWADMLQWVDALFGIPAAATSNNDGTATALNTSNITINPDGTASLPITAVGSTTINNLVDHSDGTAMSMFAWLTNMGGQGGTHQALKNSIVQGASGTPPVTPATSSDVQNSLNTLFGSTAGILGSPTLAQALQATVDAMWQTIQSWITGVNATGTGNSLANVGNLFNNALLQVDAALGLGNTANNTIASRAVTKPAFLSIDASADSVFPISQISGSSPTFVSLTPSTAVIGYIGTPDAGLKTTIVWLGSTTTNATAIYLTISSVNTATGAVTLLFTSPNILSAVSNSLTWNYYNLPTINQVTSAQGNWYAVEMRIEGDGPNYQIAGIPNHWLPANGAMSTFPQSLGASRVSLNAAAYSTTGAGNQLTANSPLTVTEFHTAPLGADIIVFASAYCPTGGGTAISNITATYNGVSMGTFIQSISNNNSSIQGLFVVFRAAGAGTGTSKAVSVIATSSGGAVPVWLHVESTSYSNVSSVHATVTTAFGNSSSLTAASTTSLLPGWIAVAGMTIVSSIGAMTWSATGGTGCTTRVQSNAAGNNYPALAILDNNNSGAVSSFTGSTTAVSLWSSLCLILKGAPVPAPSLIAAPGPPYSGNVPWFGLGGAIGVTQFPPQFYSQFNAGTFTYAVPTGMILNDFFDIIVLADGGGGGGGSGSFFGGGGHGGAWTSITLVYGVDIPLSTTTFTVNVGGGGPAGLNLFGITSFGGNGTGSSVVITGYGTVSAAGGAGGPPAAAGNPANPGVTYPGISPGNRTFGPAGPTLNTVYRGGATEFISGGFGMAPGGGAAGGGYSLSGGIGAVGAVWITAYQ